MPPAQKPTGAEDAESALTREQPVTADAATPTPVNNESAGAEGAEFIAQDLSQDPPGNDDLLRESLAGTVPALPTGPPLSPSLQRQRVFRLACGEES